MGSPTQSRKGISEDLLIVGKKGSRLLPCRDFVLRLTYSRTIKDILSGRKWLCTSSCCSWSCLAACACSAYGTMWPSGGLCPGGKWIPDPPASLWNMASWANPMEAPFGKIMTLLPYILKKWLNGRIARLAVYTMC